MDRITNHSQFYFSSDDYSFIEYNSINEIVKVIKTAKEKKLCLRHLGASHALGSSNIPRKNEVVLRCLSDNKIKRIDDSTIRVSASARLWEIQSQLIANGYELPVINGGDASPTVGGFISAGGIGKTEPGKSMSLGRSCLHGGFWENVQRIRYIDGRGHLHTSYPHSADFPFLFGSLGQFGIFIDADLKVIPSCSNSDLRNYNDDRNFASSKFTPSLIRTLWVTMFVASQREQQAWKILQKWHDKYKLIIHPVSNARWGGPLFEGIPIGYIYDITFLNFNPPLVYSENNSFKALGIAFSIETGSFLTNSALAIAMNDIYQEALNHSFELYSSVENILSSYTAKQRYKPSIYNQALSLRKENYCDNFLNVGWLDDLDLSSKGIVSFF